MTEPWYLPLSEDRPSDLRVFAFPHAGAGIGHLAPFAKRAAQQGLCVWGASLPGRQARLSEPARTGYTALVEELVDHLTPLLDRRYALFGYCGGALLAYGVARGLCDRGAPLPDRLLVASAEAPDVAEPPRQVAGLPDRLLWPVLVDNGAVPANLVEDPRLVTVAGAAVRADFAVLASYRHEALPPLPVPITVLYGGAEAGLCRGALLGWRRQSGSPLRMHELPGGHWLLDDAATLAEAVAAELPVKDARS